MRTKLVTGAVICALGIGVMTVGLTAQEGGGAGGSKIGTVNFNTVLKQYKTYQAGIAELQAVRAKANEEMKTKRQDMLTLRKKAQVYEAGSPRQSTIVHEMIALKHEIEALKERTTADLNVKQGALLKTAYDDVRKVLAGIGKERGLALILRVVSPEIRAANTLRLVDGQIGARRVLYTSGQLDLTDVVVQRMNSAK
jgi:Skp family chaperone for outer membrane proteins